MTFRPRGNHKLQVQVQVKLARIPTAGRPTHFAGAFAMQPSSVNC